MKKITLLLAIVMIVNLFAFTIPTVIYAETDNIAVGKPTTGTTQYDSGGGFHPAKATDGDQSTRWARGNYKVEGNTPNDMIKEWVQIDLEQAYPIDKVVAHTQLSDSSGYAGYLMVQLSNDPTFKSNTSKMITLEKGEPNEITTPWIANYKSEVPYRYVRMGRNSTAWVSITEIEVYPMEIEDPNSAVYNDIDGSEYEGAIKILRKLGINYAAKKDEYGVNLLMNRSTAIENIVKLFYEDPKRISTGESPFADIDKSMSCYDSVITAYDAGIIKGDLNGNFNPDLLVTVNELAVMLLRALGYEEPIESYDTWQIGVARIGDMIDLFDGIDADKNGYISYGAAAQMFVNALAAPPYNKFGSGLIGNEKPIIESKYQLTVIEGVVRETTLTSLDYDKKDADTRVIIGDTELLDIEGELNAYIGQNIRVCHDNKKKIVTAWPVDNETTTFSVSDVGTFPSISSSIYEVYDENDNLKKFKLKNGFDVVYNGACVFDFTADDLAPLNGGIILVDNDGDKTYDVVIINEYRAIEVEVIASSNDNTELMDKNGNSYSIATEKITVYDVEGKEIAPSKVATGSIVKLYIGDVNVYDTDDGNDSTPMAFVIDAVTKIEVMEAKASGKITRINGNDSITVTGTTYDFASKYGVSGTMNINESVELFFDEWDKVLFVKNTKSDTSWTVGFVIDLRLMDRFTNDYSIKIYNSKGEFQIYDLADKIRLDGYTKELKEFGEYLTTYEKDDTRKIKNEYIRYKLNSDGKLFEIDSIYVSNKEDEGTTLTFDPKNVVDGNADESLRYVSTADAFYSGNKFKFLAPVNTTTFIIPTVNGEFTTSDSYYDYYSVNSKVTSAVPDKSSFIKKVKLYMSDEYGFAGFVSVNEDYAEVDGESIKAITTSTQPWMVVESLDTVYHNEREYYQVTGYDLTGKSSVSYIIDGIDYMAEAGLIYQDHGPSKTGVDNWHTQYYAIKPKSVNEAPETEKAKYISNINEIGRGDVIRYEISGSYIRNIERVYKFDETVKPVQTEQAWKTSNSNYPNHQFAVHRFQFATITDIDAKMVRLQPIIDDSIAEPYMKGYFGKIMFVSSDSDDAIEIQNVNELANYKGDNYRVLFYCNSGAPKSAVVYEYNN